MQDLSKLTHLSALMDSTEDYIWSVDLDFRFIAFNRATAQSFEAQIGSPLCVGMRHDEQLSPELGAKWVAFYKRAIAEGPFQAEYTFAGGRTRDLSFNLIVVGGLIQGISVFSKDVTERRAQEEAKLEAEGKYRDIFNGALEGIFQTTDDARVLTANPAAASILGYDSPEEFIAAKNTAEDLWVDLDQRAHYFQLLHQSDLVRRFETQFKRKDGTPIWVSLNSRKTLAADGKTPVNEGFFEDITERKLAAEELAREKAFTEAIIDSLPDIFFVIQTNGAFLHWGRNPERILGYTSEETQAMSHAVEIVAEEDRPLATHAIEEAFASGSVTVEVRLLHKDGRKIPYLIRATRALIGSQYLVVGIGLDITERKLAELRISERDERLKEAEEVAHLGHSSWDAESNTTTWSEGMYRITGWDPAQPAPNQEERAMLYAPESWQRLNAAVAHSLATGAPYDLELQIMRPDGVLRWVRARGFAGRNRSGKVNRLFGTLQDITEQRLSEMKLRDSEERFRATYEQAAVGILHLSFDGRILRCNQRFAEFLGFSPGEVAGMTIQQLTPPEQFSESKEILNELEAGNIDERGFEKQYIRKDGRRIWVRLKTSIQRDGKGQPLHLMTFVEDITDRKRAEEALRDSEAQLREAEHIAGIGSSVWDVDTDTTIWSPEMYRIRGWDPGEPIPKHGDKSPLYTPESWRRQAAAVERALSTGEPYDLELQFVRVDGAIRWGYARGRAMFDDAGRVARLHGTLQDITERKLVEEKIKASEENYLLLLNSTAEGIFGIDMNGNCIFSNPASLRMLGYESSEELLGKNMHQVVHHSHADGSPYPAETCPILTQIREGKGIHVDHEVMWRKDGSSFQAEYWSYPIFKADEQAGGVITFLDISNRKRAEEHLAEASRKLQLSEVRHRTVFQTSQDALNISRLSDGRLVDVNKSFLDLTGFQREEVIGRTTEELGIWSNPSERMAIIDGLRRKPNIRDMEVQFKRKDGNTFWGLTSASVIEFEGVPHVLVATRDLSEAKDALQRIRDLAFYDPLTHLPNRRSLLDLLEPANDAGPHLRALLFVDLDNFKSLNDALGHHAGDLLLQEVAQRLAACVRGEGTVARMGGDEFAIVLEKLANSSDHAAEQARQTGERILAAVSLPYLVDERECHFSSSIGITVFGADLETGVEALRQGEIAMSKAKEAGRNTIRFFSPELQANVNTRVLLENEIRRAIKAEEFELYFQPQVRGSKLIGSEALIRWNHPQRGILAPGAFIDLAEETGLILPLGNWVLWRACEHVAAWAGKNPSGDAFVAVNISGKQFSQPDFVARVLETLDQTGTNPASIKLELTETSLVKDFQAVIAKMTELKSHGLKFSVDDFGTGYSSLAYLKSLPIDQLKIDRAFVKDILIDGASGAIAQAIISMGHSMGFSVIAEGVETEEQRDFLMSIGCNCFQGYLISRPVPAQEFERKWFL